MSWREYTDEDEKREEPMRQDHGTLPERAVGWVLTYPVRGMIAMLLLVIALTLFCGL